jgi:predicted outer membrane protein
MLKLGNPIRSLGLVAVFSLGAGACATGGGGMSSALAPHHQALHAISMASHVAEIEESQLALTRATTQQAREFAQRMVTDHTAAMRMDIQMMASMGMGLPGLDGSDGAAMDMARIRTALMAHPHSRPMVEDHMRAMQMLQGVTGAAFDQAFLNRQVMAHQMTLANMDRVMSSMGMTPQGGTTAAGATAAMDHASMQMPATREGMMMMHQNERAMVAMHLQMARQMAGR